MSKTKLTFRLAADNDARLLWRWRNEPSGLKNYFSPKPVPWAVHQAWFLRKQRDPRTRIFVVSAGTTPVGQVRVDVGDHRIGEMHIVLDKAARGRGWGGEAIAAVATRVVRAGLADALVARIKPDNVASVVAFLKAGFLLKKLKKVKGVICYELERKRP